MQFCDAVTAALCYYGLHHVLLGYSLSDAQRAACCAAIAAAKEYCSKYGVVLYSPQQYLPARLDAD